MSIVLVLVLAAAATEEPKFRDPPACWDGSQHELNVCASKEYQLADKAMNEQWIKTARLMKRLDADFAPPNDIIGNTSHFDELLKGQRAWLAYREAHCPIFGASGGSSKPMLIDICRRDLTQRRTEQLKSLTLDPMSGNPFYEDQ